MSTSSAFRQSTRSVNRLKDISTDSAEIALDNRECDASAPQSEYADSQCAYLTEECRRSGRLVRNPALSAAWRRLRSWLPERIQLPLWMCVVRTLARCGARGTTVFWWATRHAAMAADWADCASSLTDDLVEPLVTRSDDVTRYTRLPKVRVVEADDASTLVTTALGLSGERRVAGSGDRSLARGVR